MEADSTGGAAPGGAPGPAAPDQPASTTGHGRRLLGTDVVTPRDAMRLEEIQSTRVFLFAGAALGAIVGAALPFVDADPAAFRVLLIGIAIATVGMGWAAWSLRRPDGYRTEHSLALVASGGVAGYAAIYYFGVLSAASLPTLMGMFFFGLTHQFRIALVAYIGGALGPLALWLLVGSGAVVDRGVIQITAMSSINQGVLIALMEAVFLITFGIARGSRRSRLAAVEELEQAVRQVAQREALLDEAKRELDDALKVGGSGRFSDQQLGAFKLGPLIGRGATGEIYAAHHVATGRRAAVKLLSRDVIGNAEHVRRFIREARIARSLRTPHVVEVLEVGDRDAPLPYLAMELLTGEDLAQILRRERRLDLDAAIELIAQVGEGIDVAHAAGVVHRDLKPQNLFRHVPETGTRAWKILDFGVSRLLSHDGTLTRGQAIGTPSYMAPEQARGRKVDHRADLFALGVVAYRCLSGRPPFTGKDVPQILHNVVYSVPPRPTTLADMPPQLDLALAIALAKPPADRASSGTELADLLRSARNGALDDDVVAAGEELELRFPWGSRIK